MTEPIFSAAALADLFAIVRPWTSGDGAASKLLLSRAEPGTAEYRRLLRSGARLGRMLTVRPPDSTGPRFLYVEPSPALLEVLRDRMVDTENDTILFEAITRGDGTVVVRAHYTVILGSLDLAVLRTHADLDLTPAKVA